MATNLLSLSQDALGRDFSKIAGQFLGESPGATQTAIGSLVPAVLGGIARKGATPEGASNLLSLVNGGGTSVTSAGSLAQLFDDDPGRVSELQNLGSAKLIPAVFGARANDLATAVSSTSGIKASSAAGLMAMVVPTVLAFVKKFARENNLSANSLSSLLSSQGPNLQGSLDSRITSALGYASPNAFVGSLSDRTVEDVRRAGTAPATDTYRTTTTTAPRATHVEERRRGGMGWLPWALAALVLLGLAAMFLGRPTTPAGVETATPTSPAVTAPPVTPPQVTTPQVTPPQATTPPATTTPQATTPQATTPPATTPPTTAPQATTPGAAAAVTFPASIHFETGSNTISTADNATITAVADAIRSGDFRVALTGYTDRTGDTAANQNLARDRATTVRDALIAAGVPEGSIEMRPPMSVETGAGTVNAEARRVDISRL